MDSSLWEQSVRHWLRSMCVWCCLGFALVVTANTKRPLSIAAEDVALSATVGSPHPTREQQQIDGAIMQRIEHFDLSQYEASAFGDQAH